MQISASNFTLSYSMQGNGKEAKELAKSNLEKLGIDVDKTDLFKDISDDAIIKQSFKISVTQITIQGNLNEIMQNKGNILDFIKDFKDLSSMSTDELLGENGYFSPKNTSKRLSDFVLNTANNDANMLREGRRGLIEGFNEASKGLNNTDLAQKTIEMALKAIDEQLEKLGESIINFKA